MAAREGARKRTSSSIGTGAKRPDAGCDSGDGFGDGAGPRPGDASAAWCLPEPENRLEAPERAADLLSCEVFSPHAAAPKPAGACEAGAIGWGWAGSSAGHAAIRTAAGVAMVATSKRAVAPGAAGLATDEVHAASGGPGIAIDGAPSGGQGDLLASASLPFDALRCRNGTGRSTAPPPALWSHGASAKLTSEAPPRAPEWRSRTTDSATLGAAWEDAPSAGLPGGTPATGSAKTPSGPTRVRSPSAPHMSLQG